MEKRGFLFVVYLLLFVIVFSLNVNALNANFSTVSPSNSLVERAVTNFINFSIGALDMNITRVEVNITGSINADPDMFDDGTNGTSASNYSFSYNNLSNNLSNPYMSRIVNLVFTNNTTAGFIQNQTTQNFWFNVTGKSQAASLMQFTITVMGTNGTTNSSIPAFGFSFRFSGYVKNETGSVMNGTNVTLYQFTSVPNGPPVETPVSSVWTDTNGHFAISGINASGGLMYKLKMIHYNSSGIATKVGTILPPFPAEMFYPQTFSGDFEFMKPPTLNGTVFYVEDAATINISATNGTRSQLFGYMVMEQKNGFEVASNFRGNVSSVQVIVPLNRAYTVMVLREANVFPFTSNCTSGSFMNDTSCPTPPKSNSTTPTVAGQFINMPFNLTTIQYNLYGCINVSGNSSPITNVSNIIPRLLPWTGFVPPIKADMGNKNLSNTNQLNYSDPRCAGFIAWYNISLISGDYLVEFYGRNSTADSAAEWVADFQNVTVSADTNINISMAPLAGAYATGGDINTTKITINLQNSSGSAITQDTPHVELYVKHTSFGELHYIIDEMTNGTFSFPVLSGSSVKTKVFSNNAPPKEKALNLSLSQNNITLISMKGGDAGFRKVNSSGDLTQLNVTTLSVNMRFLRAGGSCDSINAVESCEVTEMNATSFNPMKALVAGKINMEMKLTSSGVTITFYNFDMFSAKQPPMESVMNDQASSGGSSANQLWEFGSFVPSDVYDYAVIGIPYSESTLNESRDFNMSIPTLYDENWDVAWNLSSGNNTDNLTASVDEYLGNTNNRSYNSTGYRNFLSSGGRNCSKSDSNLTGSSNSEYCFVNTSTNILYMRVPHFSGIAPNVIGTAPTSTTSDDSSGDSSGGGGGGNTFSVSKSQLDSGYTRTMNLRDKLKFNVSNESHLLELTGVTTTTATIKVTSTPQTAVLSEGETKKFELNGDGFYDLAATLNDLAITNSTIRANVKIVSNSDPVSSDVSETTGGEPSEITGAAIGTEDETTDNVNKVGKKSVWWLLGLILVAIAAAAGFVLYKMKRK